MRGINRGVMRGTGLQERMQSSSVALMVNDELITDTSAVSRQVPEGVYSINIEAWGAGAGGGFYTSNPSGGGGGGGAYTKRIFKAVTPGDIIEFEIGLGGIGDHTGGATGEHGGSTYVDGMTAEGGYRGDSFGDSFGDGGVASGGDVNTDGDDGTLYDSGTSTGGRGGDSPNGGTGGEGSHDTFFGGGPTVYAENGTSPGAGGGGGSPDGTAPASIREGADGANGGIKFTWLEELLIDGFESFSSGLPTGWTELAAPYAKASAAAITQGSFSWNIEAWPTGGGSSSPSFYRNLDALSGYEGVAIDYKFTGDLGALDGSAFGFIDIVNGGSPFAMTEITDGSGATRTAILPQKSLNSLDDFAIILFCGSGAGDSVHINVDNLRAVPHIVETSVLLDGFESVEDGGSGNYVPTGWTYINPTDNSNTYDGQFSVNSVTKSQGTNSVDAAFTDITIVSGGYDLTNIRYLAVDYFNWDGGGGDTSVTISIEIPFYGAVATQDFTFSASGNRKSSGTLYLPLMSAVLVRENALDFSSCDIRISMSNTASGFTNNITLDNLRKITEIA